MTLQKQRLQGPESSALTLTNEMQRHPYDCAASAADLKVLGAVHPIIQQLESEVPEVQASAAHVLGVAASNNLPFQTDALEAQPRLLHQLLKVCLRIHQHC